MEEPSGSEALSEDRGRAARGTARPRLHAAAERLLSRVTLDDLTAFVTVGRLAEESGLSNGAIYSAARPSEGIDGRTRSAPQAIVREMFLSWRNVTGDLYQEIEAAMEGCIGGSSTDRQLVERIATILGRHVEESARGESGWEYTQLTLAAGVALNDPAVRERLTENYLELGQSYRELVVAVLDLTERVPVDGISLDELIWMMVDVADAGAMRHRATGMASGTATLVQMVFAAATRRRDDHEDESIGRLAFDVRTPDPDDRDRIAYATRRLTEESGWDAVTLTRVQEISGVDRSVLVAVATTRHHLAAPVWADVVSSIERRAQGRSNLAAATRVEELVRDIADAACARRTLVASLLQARLHDQISAPLLPAPEQCRLSTLLGALLVEHSGRGAGSRAVAARTAVDALLIGAAGTDTSAGELTAVLTAGLLE